MSDYLTFDFFKSWEIILEVWKVNKICRKNETWNFHVGWMEGIECAPGQV